MTWLILTFAAIAGIFAGFVIYDSLRGCVADWKKIQHKLETTAMIVHYQIVTFGNDGSDSQ